MKIKKHPYRIFTALTVLGLVFAAGLAHVTMTQAADLLIRSITLGTSVPSAVTTHDFEFAITPSANNLGSIEFEYCSNDPFLDTPCTAPAGLDVSGAALTTEAGEVGFTVHPSSTTNKLILTRVPVALTGGPVRYLFSNVVNPSSAHTSTYVRVTTYGTDDATGSFIDGGSLVFSTSGQLSVTAFVPPYLRFCVGVTVAFDCIASGDRLDLGVLTPTATRSATSQMAASTNDPFGYTIAVLGSTMTSGNNIINPLITPTVSVPGSSQFGINVRANTQPPVGQNIQGFGTGVPATDYGVSNRFKFVEGDMIAGSSLPTDVNIYTVSYIANIPSSQSVGIYATTATYVATVQF